MQLTVPTTFGSLKVALMRPLDFATEAAKIQFRGRAIEVGFQFRRARRERWRLWDFLCEPVRGELGSELVNEIRRIGKREILAWLHANREAVYRSGGRALVCDLPAFRADVRRLTGEINYAVIPRIQERWVWEITGPDGSEIPAQQTCA